MKRILILILGVLSTVSAYAYTTSYDQKYFTPIKLDVKNVKNIIDKANKKDPKVLNHFTGDGYASVIFPPQKYVISDTDMSLMETYGYHYTRNYVKKRNDYSLSFVSTNCSLSYNVHANASFDADGRLFKFETTTGGVNPKNEPQCNYKGEYKYDPKIFSDLKLDTKQLNTLFNETTKADKDIYTVENISDNYKKLVFRPYVYSEHINTNRKTVYSYEFSKKENKPGIYSFKSDQLDCDRKTRLSSTLVFTEDGKFKSMLVGAPSYFLTFMHDQICEI